MGCTWLYTSSDSHKEECILVFRVVINSRWSAFYSHVDSYLRALVVRSYVMRTFLINDHVLKNAIRTQSALSDHRNSKSWLELYEISPGARLISSSHMWYVMTKLSVASCRRSHDESLRRARKPHTSKLDNSGLVRKIESTRTLFFSGLNDRAF